MCLNEWVKKWQNISSNTKERLSFGFWAALLVAIYWLAPIWNKTEFIKTICRVNSTILYQLTLLIDWRFTSFFEIFTDEILFHFTGSGYWALQRKKKFWMKSNNFTISTRSIFCIFSNTQQFNELKFMNINWIEAQSYRWNTYSAHFMASTLCVEYLKLHSHTLTFHPCDQHLASCCVNRLQALLQWKRVFWRLVCGRNFDFDSERYVFVLLLSSLDFLCAILAWIIEMHYQFVKISLIEWSKPQIQVKFLIFSFVIFFCLFRCLNHFISS